MGADQLSQSQSRRGVRSPLQNEQRGVYAHRHRLQPGRFRRMVQIRQRVLTSLMLAAPLLPAAQKFYPDDPIRAEPAPLNVAHANAIDIDAYYDFFRSTFFAP